MVDKKMIGGAVALVVLAAIVLMGLAVVEGFSEYFRDETGTLNMTMTTGAVNVSTRMGTSEQYPYPEISFCKNSTGDVLAATNYSFADGSAADGGLLTILDSGSEFASQLLNCTGTYLADSSLQGQADKFSTGLAIFGSFIGVLVIAILGLFVMKLFTRKKDD